MAVIKHITVRFTEKSAVLARAYCKEHGIGYFERRVKDNKRPISLTVSSTVEKLKKFKQYNFLLVRMISHKFHRL